MTQPDKAALAECIHANLQFNSGDYYVSCIDCHAMWMRKSRGSQPEYGYDHQGRKIGAAPEEATGNQNAMMSGPRALRANDGLREARGPDTLLGMIAEIYSGLDAEDAAWVDYQWIKFRNRAAEDKP